MKKVFTLFALLLTIVIGAKAADEVVVIGSNNSGEYTISGTTHDVAGYSNGTNSGTIADADDGQGASAGSKMNSTTNIGSKLSSKGHVRFTVSAGETVRFYYYCQSSGKATTISTSDYSQSESNYDSQEVSIASKNTLYYVDFVYENAGTYAISHNGDNIFAAVLKFTAAAPAGPTINEHPQSAAYASGDPIAALTVDATASAGTLTYQWYSCDDAEKTNAATIGGATSASYTPTGAGFFFVNVKDDNGNVDSDVAQITVSEAEAPTISVSGTPASDVVVGTEVILTAETTGTPTPTVTWYDGDTDEAITTGASYTVPTDVAGTFSIYAVASNGVEPDATSAVQTIVVKEQVATPTFNPNGAYFEESQEVAIATTTEGATIQYSTDGGSTWNDYTEAFTVTETTTVQAKAVKAGYIDSEAATATFTLVTLDPQVDVTGAASWDWSKFGTKEIKLTDSTTPSKSTEFVLSNAVNYGLCSSISADFGNAQQLKVTTEYVVRDTKYFQGGSIKFNTTVPGKVTVKFCNTGNRTDEALRRFLNVNGINYGTGAMRSDETTTTTVSVAAGEVAITGKFGPSYDQADQYLRIYTIEFTPTSTETVTIPEEGVATYVTKSALDFSEQTEFTAYAVTEVNDAKTSVKTEAVTAVPAGTPLLIKGAAGDYDVEIVESADDIENLLQVSNGTVTGADGNVFAYSKTALKFKKVGTTTKVPAGKCYLEIDGAGQSIDVDFEGEATGVNGVAEAKAEVAPVKVIKNGQLFIGNFNVAGQQVK